MELRVLTWNVHTGNNWEEVAEFLKSKDVPSADKGMSLPVAQAEGQAKPIQTFKDIAGKWEGQMTSSIGFSTPVVMIINEDGTVSGSGSGL